MFQNPSRIYLGKCGRIGSRCPVWTGPANGCIGLGDNVPFGPDALVTAATYRHRCGSPVSEQPMAEADVIIGNDDCWATRAVILSGTTIGDGSIVAAGSVVKVSFPPMSIIAGSPAKVVSARLIAG